MLTIEPADFLVVILWLVAVGLAGLAVSGSIWIARDILDRYKKRRKNRDRD